MDDDDVPPERASGEVSIGADSQPLVTIRERESQAKGVQLSRERTDVLSEAFTSIINDDGIQDFPAYYKTEGTLNREMTHLASSASYVASREATEWETQEGNFDHRPVYHPRRTSTLTVTEDLQPHRVPCTLPTPAHAWQMPAVSRASQDSQVQQEHLPGNISMLPLSEFVDMPADNDFGGDTGVRGCSSGVVLCGSAVGEFSITWSKGHDSIGLGPDALVPVKMPTTEDVQQVAQSCVSDAASGEDVGVSDMEWFERQRITGVVGRLVQYPDGRYAAYDIKRLVRTPAGYLQVTQVSPIGPANQHGVKIGDRLVSINGQKPSATARAEEILLNLSGPTALVFLGFIGSVGAEVLIDTEDHECGLPESMDLVAWDRHLDEAGQRRTPRVEVHDEYIFHPGAAALMLESRAGEGEDAGVGALTSVQKVAHDLALPAAVRQREQQSSGGGGPGPSINGSSAAPAAAAAGPDPAQLIELHRTEAQSLLVRALTAKQTSSSL